MGHATAAGFAEAVNEGQIGLTAALHHHVRANHFPPLPVAYVDVAQQVIERASDAVFTGYGCLFPEVLEEEIDITEAAASGCSPRESVERDGHVYATVGTLLDILHLGAFVPVQDDLYDDEEDA